MKLVTSVQKDGLVIENEVLDPSHAEYEKREHDYFEYQAKIHLPDYLKKPLVEAAFTYEGEDGKYLGVETDIEYFENERFKNPYFLILQLNLPRGTEVVKCELTYDERGFVSDWWGVFWIIAGALTLLLLASGIVAIWR